jgi:hypothetical protein
MARSRTAERGLQGQPLPSFGVLASTLGQGPDHEAKPERRELAMPAAPFVRW